MMQAYRPFSSNSLCYWNTVGETWQENRPDALWRAHCDVLNCKLLARWLPSASVFRLLKTDLFDEAVGEGLYPQLAARCQSVVGVELAPATFNAARSKYPGLLVVGADVRALPFRDGAFDSVVSLSTLDHFESFQEVTASLKELNRVVCGGGQLILTMDNLVNPVVALRNALPFSLLYRLKLVPYRVGATYGPKHLSRMLQQNGFDVRRMTAVMHCPRVIAVAMARLIQRSAPMKSQKGFLRALMRFERLANWPTRYLTGHFIAVYATKC